MSNPLPESEHFRKLFVGGLNRITSEDTLKAYFKQYGEVVDCKIIRDAHTRRSRGFAFVTYKRAHMVDDAQAAKPHEIDGRIIQPKRAVPRGISKQPHHQVTLNKLYVGALSEDIQEEDLIEHFSQYGNILKVSLVTDVTTGKKRGFAFIDFDDYDPVDKAVLRSHVLKGKAIVVKKGLSRQNMENIIRIMHRARSRSYGGYGVNNFGTIGSAFTYGGNYGNRYGNSEYVSVGGGFNRYHSANYVNWGPVSGSVGYSQRSQEPFRGRGRSSSYSGPGRYFGGPSSGYY